jgi:flotillin
MDPTIQLLIIIGAAVVVVALIVLAFAKGYRKVGPNEVLVVSGGRLRTVTEPDGTTRKVGYRVRVGGGTFVKPLIEQAEVLPIEVVSLSIETPDCLSKNGVAVSAESVAQVKIGSDDHKLRRAAEQFLGKGVDGIREVSTQILDGIVRGAIGSRTVEQTYQDREGFAQDVFKTSAEEFEFLGLRMVSFALKAITDPQGYIESMAKPRIAQVKRDASVAEAEAERDATIKTADARKDGDVARYGAETEIAAASRDYEKSRAEFNAQINEKKANADFSYDLARQRMQQQIKAEEIGVRLVEKERGIEVETKEVARKEKELEATVRKVAEARRYQVEQEAAAENARLVEEAKANAESIRLTGEAEADAMKKKAAAFRDYNEAAVYQMFVAALPELARAVAEPLSRVEKIIMVDGGSGSGGVSRLTGQVAQILAQLPTVVESLSGVDIAEAVKRFSSGQGSVEDPGS